MSRACPTTRLPRSSGARWARSSPGCSTRGPGSATVSRPTLPGGASSPSGFRWAAQSADSNWKNRANIMIPFNDGSGSKCEEVGALLSEYTDNRLSTHKAWVVEKHLAGCASCAEEARQMRATVDLLRSAPRFDTDD